MADPRFYDNRGPISLAELCARLNLTVPEGADPAASIEDVAGLEGGGAGHLAHCTGKKMTAVLGQSAAGFILVDAALADRKPCNSIVLVCREPASGFATAAETLYPEHAVAQWNQDTSIDRSAQIGEGVRIAPGAVIGKGADIGDGTSIGPNVVIGRGVAVGKDCEISANSTITHAYLGDNVVILPGAQIGQAGFGFASGPRGHKKIPQLGRVIIQDQVEIGACTTIDRGSLGDTVVGEGTKIDNLVQVGHNCIIGRHSVIVAQVGISGSCELGEFVVLGGQVGLADHVSIGDGARLAARAAVAPGELPGGQDYGGAPARPVQQWRRELAAVALLARRPKRASNG